MSARAPRRRRAPSRPRRRRVLKGLTQAQAQKVVINLDAKKVRARVTQRRRAVRQTPSQPIILPVVRPVSRIPPFGGVRRPAILSVNPAAAAVEAQVAGNVLSSRGLQFNPVGEQIGQVVKSKGQQVSGVNNTPAKTGVVGLNPKAESIRVGRDQAVQTDRNKASEQESPCEGREEERQVSRSN